MIPGIKAYQGIVSDTGLEQHGHMDQFNLRPYDDPDTPVVVIGVNNVSDLRLIRKHKSVVIVFWCGRDSWSRFVSRIPKKRRRIIHITALPNVQKYLERKGFSCHLIRLRRSMVSLT